MKFCLTVGEVEHEGDLENVVDDITSSGGTILNSIINADAETAEIYVEVKGNVSQFREEFKATESYGFLN
jgi:adenine/guanine phosphoribosyltransferase-like PRPP-binding protein